MTIEDMIQRCREAAKKQDDAAAARAARHEYNGHAIGLHQGAAIAYRNCEAWAEEVLESTPKEREDKP